MQRFIFLLLITSLLSCSAPKQLIKSNDLLPACHCEGNSKLTIVMDAGMGNWSLFYQPIFQKLKQNYKVCIIDRPGYAMDTVTGNVRDLKTVAKEIDSALAQKGIHDNIILVGHSLGGLYMRMYQSLFTQKVQGLVLLDAAHSKQFNRLPGAFYELLKNQPEQLEEVISIAQKGYLKYTKSKIPTFGLPDYLLEDYYKIATQPEFYYSMKMEVEVFEENLKQAQILNNLDNLPLLIVGSKNNMDKSILPGKSRDFPYEEHNKKWFELQQELAELSNNSTFVASEANHYLNVTDVELVYNSIIDWMKINFDHEN